MLVRRKCKRCEMDSLLSLCLGDETPISPTLCQIDLTRALCKQRGSGVSDEWMIFTFSCSAGIDIQAVLVIFLWFVIKGTKAVSEQRVWISDFEPLRRLAFVSVAATPHIKMDVTLFVMFPELGCVANWESCDGSSEMRLISASVCVRTMTKPRQNNNKQPGYKAHATRWDECDCSNVNGRHDCCWLVRCF